MLHQTFESFELIVVDDGSTDNTEATVRSFGDNRIKYIRMPSRRGAGAARNAGILIASSELIAFQDSDDEWMSTKLDEQLLKISEDPDAGVVYSDMLRVLSSGECSLFPAPDFQPGILDPVSGRYRVQNIGILSCMIRRPAFDRVGLFNEDLPALEDLELLIRISQKWKMIKIATPLVKYYETIGLSSDYARLAAARRQLIELYSVPWAADKRLLARELAEIAGLEKIGQR